MIRTPANLFHECEKYAKDTGGPSSSCEMIILHNNSHGSRRNYKSLYENIYDRS